MGLKETFHLPSVALEMEFMGDPALARAATGFRAAFKQELMKRLISDGVAFQERGEQQAWNESGGPASRLEGVVDAWILERKHPCAKARDNHSGKVWWIVECEEQVSIMMLPGDGG